jgi:hypothetical protein
MSFPSSSTQHTDIDLRQARAPRTCRTITNTHTDEQVLDGARLLIPLWVSAQQYDPRSSDSGQGHRPLQFHGSVPEPRARNRSVARRPGVLQQLARDLL